MEKKYPGCNVYLGDQAKRVDNAVEVMRTISPAKWSRSKLVRKICKEYLDKFEVNPHV